MALKLDVDEVVHARSLVHAVEVFELLEAVLVKRLRELKQVPTRRVLWVVNAISALGDAWPPEHLGRAVLQAEVAD